MNKPKILIVDDSQLNREILSYMLSDLYEIAEAENGIHAVNILEKQAHEFSLVLLDIIMPEMDGYGVLAYMNKSHNIEDLPVIIISSETSPVSINKAYDMGAVDFISRPYDSHVVRRRISNIIALYEKQRNLAAIVAEEIYERTKSQDRMVSVLSQIVEFRNQESGLHVMHIQQFSEIFAQSLAQKTDKYALDTAEIMLIRQASALHDIGKITIPDEILNKPGRLTTEEFEVIKTHSASGAEMLERLPDYKNDRLLKTAYEVCRWHHERYDGRGYPDGLAGDDIPVSAQIVALADVYDALTSERCYKKAIPHKEALEMIVRGECGTFNPLLLECLTENADRLSGDVDGDLSGTRESQEIYSITEEVARHGELSLSNHLISQLRFEQARADYFEAAAGKMTFVSKKYPSMLILSPELAGLMDQQEITPDPDYKKLLLDSFGLAEEELQILQAEATAEKPDFSISCECRSAGKRTSCRINFHNVFSDEDKTQLIGVMGTVEPD